MHSIIRPACLAAFVATSGAVAAASCPLGDWTDLGDGGMGGSFHELHFIIEMTPNDYDPPFAELGPAVFGVDDIGSSVSYRPGDEGFEAFAVGLTNGHADRLTMWARSPQGGGVGHGYGESTAFGQDPDFTGHSIGEIRMTLHDMSLNSFDDTYTYFTYNIEVEVFAACPQDVNGDAAVSSVDLLAVLADWGAYCDDGDCPGDIDCDGDVGIGDLLTLVAAWGDCPEGVSAP